MSILGHTFPPDLNSIYDEKFSDQLARTQASVASLNQARLLIQNPTLLMRPILVKEAEASSRLEGTQASIEDVYRAGIEDQSNTKKNDVREIRNYENAMLEGILLIKKYGQLNNMVIRQIHKILLSGVRGKDKNPGNFRTDKVWIGERGTNLDEARYVPPEAVYVPQLMNKLEEFIKLSSDNKMNPLLACGIIHHRFEAIHPFKDGNGRTGRLLISLYLVSRKMLKEPMLYASGYFESHRRNYMDALSQVDTNENWKLWLDYFLKGMEDQANKSLQLALSINSLFKKSELKIQNSSSRVSLIKALEYCFVQPFLTAPILNKGTDIALTSCKRYLEKLEEQKIIRDIGLVGNKKVYINESLMKILQAI